MRVETVWVCDKCPSDDGYKFYSQSDADLHEITHHAASDEVIINDYEARAVSWTFRRFDTEEAAITFWRRINSKSYGVPEKPVVKWWGPGWYYIVNFHHGYVHHDEYAEIVPPIEALKEIKDKINYEELVLNQSKEALQKQIKLLQEAGLVL